MLILVIHVRSTDRKHIIACFTLWFGVTSLCYAQTERSGSPVSWNMPQLIMGLDQPEILPEVNETALFAEDVASIEDYSAPYRFAFAHEVQLNLQNAGRWTNLPNGDRVWVLAIDCPSALSLAITFQDVDIPRGGRLDIYTPDHSEHLGPIAQRGEAVGSFGTAHFRGHELIIEYFEPYAFRGEGEIQVSYVSEGYRSLDASSLSCYASLHEHAASRELQSLSESVVMILVDHGQRIATGTLVNNTNNNAVPYILTAAEALVGPPEEMVFAFHYVDVSCMYPYVDGCAQWVVSGASLLHAGSNSQLSLLQLDHLPVSMVTPFFAGWHVTDESPVNRHWSIQHALGLAQSCKEYFGQMQPVASPDGIHRSFTGLHEGASAAGSIGSPLFDAEHDLIGVFVGGNSDCQGQGHDYYTLLKDVWNELDDFLSPTSIEEDRINGMYYSNDWVNSAPSGVIDIYPNPASDYLSINLDQSDELISLEIYDLQGRSLACIPTKNKTIDISALPNGTFTLRVMTKNAVSIERLVVRN